MVSEYKHGREAPQYLVKWCGLEYSDSTWEQEEELCRDGVGKVRGDKPSATWPLQSAARRQGSAHAHTRQRQWAEVVSWT